MNRTSLLALILISGLVVSACATEDPTLAEPQHTMSTLEGVSVEVYHSPGCACCHEWVGYIEKRGATVTLTELDDLGQFKVEHGIPAEAGSCHTALIDGYVVEGHVPSEALAELLITRPNVVGIALAGMPLDSPGMGGSEASWMAQPVMSINNDGTLTSFAF